MPEPKHLSPDHERKEYRNIVVRTAAMYGVMVLAYFGQVPLWGIVVANVLFYFSVYVSVHEIGHNYQSNRLHWIGRMVPLATPIWGGVRVFQETHRRHHLYFCTDHDPWLPYYAGHPLRALFFNMIEPEVNAYNFMKIKGVDKELIVNYIYNIFFIAVGAYLFADAYWVYLISTRLIHGLAVFFFNYSLHRNKMSADADYSVYNRESWMRPIFPIARLIWGKAVVVGFMYHDRHHCLRQWRYHPLDYETLEDIRDYSPFIKEWPAKAIYKLSDIQAQRDELRADMPG